MKQYLQENVCDVVREAEQNYTSGHTQISKHVDWSLKENIETIEAYVNSKHTSGKFDSLDREKPFFNIVTAAENIWYRATDLDRRNIRIKATKMEDILMAFIGTQKLNEWMRKSNFGKFLNKWGRALARYGSAMTKWNVVDGELKAEVIPWNRLIIDDIDVHNSPIIEIVEYTPAQLLRKKGYDQSVAKDLITSLEERESLDGQEKDNKAKFVKVYHVTGEMPKALLRDEPKDAPESEWGEFVLQVHAVSFFSDKNGNRKDFTLMKGRLSQNPYMLTHLIEEDNRSMAIGAVEHLFESQWMVNHNAKAIKDQLDLASKLIFQTADGNYLNVNALTAIETGDILIHEPNSPLTQMANNSHDISALQSFAGMWAEQAKEITSTPDVISGNTLPSGTAYRQAAILNQESHSLYELMTESKALYLEDAMREYVLPYIKKKLVGNKDEIVATLESHDITYIDPIYVKSTAEGINKRAVIDSLTQGQLPVDISQEETEAKITEELEALGNQRGFKPDELDKMTWDEVFEDFVWDVEVEIVNENTEKEVTMTTLTTVLQTIAGNPGVLQDPAMKLLFTKILEETGRISPIELSSLPTPQQTAPEAPAPDLSALQNPEQTPTATV